jgi:hypothetical protein
MGRGRKFGSGSVCEVRRGMATDPTSVQSSLVIRTSGRAAFPVVVNGLLSGSRLMTSGNGIARGFDAQLDIPGRRFVRGPADSGECRDCLDAGGTQANAGQRRVWHPSATGSGPVWVLEGEAEGRGDVTRPKSPASWAVEGGEPCISLRRAREKPGFQRSNTPLFAPEESRSRRAGSSCSTCTP